MHIVYTMSTSVNYAQIGYQFTIVRIYALQLMMDKAAALQDAAETAATAVSRLQLQPIFLQVAGAKHAHNPVDCAPHPQR